MYCIRCGSRLPDDAQFCFKCGLMVTNYEGDLLRSDLCNPNNKLEECKEITRLNLYMMEKCSVSGLSKIPISSVSFLYRNCYGEWSIEEDKNDLDNTWLQFKQTWIYKVLGKNAYVELNHIINGIGKNDIGLSLEDEIDFYIKIGYRVALAKGGRGLGILYPRSEIIGYGTFINDMYNKFLNEDMELYPVYKVIRQGDNQYILK